MSICLTDVLDGWLCGQLDSIERLGSHLRGLHAVPGIGGEFSVLIPPDVHRTLGETFDQNSREMRFEELQDLKELRNDGGEGYFAENLDEKLIGQANIGILEDRAILCSAFGSQLGGLTRENISRAVCIVSVASGARSFRLEYGNARHGTVPATGFVTHLAAHAVNLRQGSLSSAVLHVHPPHLVDLSRVPEVQASADLNRLLYSQRHELPLEAPERIALVPFHAPASRDQIRDTLPVLDRHRIIVWERHGVFIRERSLERCLELVEYLEGAAAAAIRDLGLFSGRLRKMPDTHFEGELSTLKKRKRLRVLTELVVLWRTIQEVVAHPRQTSRISVDEQTGKVTVARGALM